MIVTEAQLKDIEKAWDNYGGDGVSTDEVYGMIETIRQLRACLADVCDAWVEGYNEDWDGYEELFAEYERVMAYNAGCP